LITDTTHPVVGQLTEVSETISSALLEGTFTKTLYLHELLIQLWSSQDNLLRSSQKLVVNLFIIQSSQSGLSEGKGLLKDAN
jgi:hypothetical protein